MPTKRTRRKRQPKSRTEDFLQDWQRIYFETGELPEKITLENLNFQKNHEKQLELWEKCKKEILSSWIRKRPGSRPYYFWHIRVAVVIPINRHDDNSVELTNPARKIISGTGTPLYMTSRTWPHHIWGVPKDWNVEFHRKIYKYLNRSDINKIEFLNENDPLLIESEAAYLQRFKLLKPSEQKRLTKEDFLPVSIFDII